MPTFVDMEKPYCYLLFPSLLSHCKRKVHFECPTLSSSLPPSETQAQIPDLQGSKGTKGQVSCTLLSQTAQTEISASGG